MDFFNTAYKAAKDAASSVASSAHLGVASVAPEYVTVQGRQYQIWEKMGEGGFAFVYKVSDSAGLYYALKRILLVDRKAAESAEREIGFLKRIPRHRAIVELIASEVNSKEALLLFEYCGGGSVYHLIEKRIEQRRPLAEAEVWAIFHAACEAVEHLHSQEPRIIHRDLKVENLLVADRGVVLCDFGSATTRVWNPKASSNERRQCEEDVNNNTTMSYRSPEMADLYSGHSITEKSDIWALGVLLYRLAYAEPPWETDSSLGILNCKYKIPHHDFSENVPNMIKMIWKMDPHKRPDVYDVLDKVLSLRGKKMSSTMAQRRDAYKSNPGNKGTVPASNSGVFDSAFGVGSGSGGGTPLQAPRPGATAASASGAVAVDGGFVAASLFDSLDWQEAAPGPTPARSQVAPMQQQQQQQQQHQRALSGSGGPGWSSLQHGQPHHQQAASGNSLLFPGDSNALLFQQAPGNLQPGQRSPTEASSPGVLLPKPRGHNRVASGSGHTRRPSGSVSQAAAAPSTASKQEEVPLFFQDASFQSFQAPPAQSSQFATNTFAPLPQNMFGQPPTPQPHQAGIPKGSGTFNTSAASSALHGKGSGTFNTAAALQPAQPMAMGSGGAGVGAGSSISHAPNYSSVASPYGVATPVATQPSLLQGGSASFNLQTRSTSNNSGYLSGAQGTGLVSSSSSFPTSSMGGSGSFNLSQSQQQPQQHHQQQQQQQQPYYPPIHRMPDQRVNSTPQRAPQTLDDMFK